MKIDLVVPYVNALDPVWQKVFIQEKIRFYGSKDAVSTNRFRGMDNFFRYFFRSVEKNMPWINNVFLLVQTYSQVPSWLDQTKIKIITHDQFIPAEFLPTFNSGTIEMFLQNIPGLEEHFIYANDDIFALKAMYPSDFFNAKGCVFNYLLEKDAGKNDWRQMCQNNHDVIFNTKHALPFIRLDHEFRPYLKSKMQECYLKNSTIIKNSISQFRLPKNLTVFLFSLDLIRERLQTNTRLKIGYLCSTSPLKEIKDRLSRSDSVCLNDTVPEIDIYNNTFIRAFFYTVFTKKSKYELTDTNSLKVEFVHTNVTKAYGQPNTYLYF